MYYLALILRFRGIFAHLGAIEDWLNMIKLRDAPSPKRQRKIHQPRVFIANEKES